MSTPAVVDQTRDSFHGLAAFVPRTLHREKASPHHWSSEGTLLFADVSGFTRLTEKLSKRGKIGAEEIVKTISSVWDSLLSGSLGPGDVLKFGGDALLVFYAGEDHAVRASHAALEMQRALKATGRIETDSGPVRLRMSIGIHSAEFQFMLCGDRHLELFVVGEAVTETVETEEIAGPQQVVASSSTAALLHSAQVRDIGEKRVLVRSVTKPSSPSRPSIETGELDLERYIPGLLRGRLTEIEEEHRPATIAFVEFGGIDGLIADSGPKEAFDRLQALTTQVMTATDEYGVLLAATDIAADGGKYMLTAGAPDAIGDGEARMLRVARRIVEADVGLQVRVGVSSGHVFVGSVGAPFRRAYVTMGDTANLAARLASRAPWGAVLAADEVVAAVEGRFFTEGLAPFSVKGKLRPVSASLVTGVNEASTRTVSEVPLVGRNTELEILLGAMTDLAAGRGRAVELVGEIGVGKSRLLDELSRNADGRIPWVAVRCDPFENSSPFHSARQLIRRAVGIPPDADGDIVGEALVDLVAKHAPQLAPWLPLLAIPFGAHVPTTPETEQIAPRFRPPRLRQTTVEFLESLIRRPTVMTIENAGFMDESSAELMVDLIDATKRHPWLIVVSRRDTATGLHSGLGYEAKRIDIEPLAPEAMEELAARLAERHPVPVHLLPQLAERSAGNPMVLAEMVVAAQTGQDELPRSIEAMVAARIDGLPTRERRLLRDLSVLGTRFDGALVDEIFGAVDPSLEPLEGFLERTGDGWAFANPLVRQVAYEGLPFSRRRELHGLVADALEADDSPRPEMLAFHYARAERWPETWRWARLAANDAVAAGANAAAGELFELAMTAGRRIDMSAAERLSVVFAAGEALESAGLADRALEAYSSAISLTADPVDQLSLVSRRARIYESTGRYPQALRIYGSAITRAELITPGIQRTRLLAHLHEGYATVRFRQGRFEDAIEHARMTASLAEQAGDLGSRARAFHLLDRSHSARGDSEAALAYRDEALSLFALLGDLPAQGTVLHDLGAEAQRQGQLDEALWMFQRSREVRDRSGDVAGGAAATNSIGEILLEQGEFSEARTAFSQALRAWRGARVRQGVAQASLNLGKVALALGQSDEAVRLLEEALVEAVQIGAEGLLVPIRLALANGYSRLDRHVEAWDSATEALSMSQSASQIVQARTMRADALRATGGAVRADRELAEAMEIARREGNGHPPEMVGDSPSAQPAIADSSSS